MHFSNIFVAVVVALSSTVVAAPQGKAVKEGSVTWERNDPNIRALVNADAAYKAAQQQPVKMSPPIVYGRGQGYKLTYEDAQKADEKGWKCRDRPSRGWLGGPGPTAYQYCSSKGLNAGAVYHCTNVCNGFV
ncbi:MAG: hypothetical protein M1823_005117 [Watsoniomyces obsoletus]|nr:MAG: hypothetical protein M1823_005117 [Watsoniomyces obsoletus]